MNRTKRKGVFNAVCDYAVCGGWWLVGSSGGAVDLNYEDSVVVQYLMICIYKRR